MGQSCGRYSQFSAAQVEAYNKAKERFIIPVTTRDHLCSRLAFHMCIGVRPDRAIPEVDTSGPNEVFDLFSTKGKPTDYWSLSNFKDFLVATSLVESGSRLTEVAPLLYRMMIALGSFPYQNEPLQHLTIDVLSVALAMIRCKQDGERYHVDSPYDEGMQQRWLDSVHLRLLFQSIANHDALSAVSHNNLQRTNGDDEDLLQVLAYLFQHNYLADLGNPKSVREGPELPKAPDLPTSRSKMLGIPVSSVELETLIRFLLTFTLCPSGIGPEHFTEYSGEVDVVSRHILNSFTGIYNGQPKNDVDWTTFNYTVENYLPNLFTGLRRLIVPFYESNPAWLQKLKDKPSDLAAAPTTMTQPVFMKGTLLNMPLLAQLATFLPTNLALDTASVTFSESSRTVDLDRLKSLIIQQKNPLLVLFSANNSEIGFGAFLDRVRPRYGYFETLNGDVHLEADIIFQHAPVHQTFGAVKTPQRPSASSELALEYSNMTENTVASSLAFTVALGNFIDHHATLSLTRGRESQPVHFNRPLRSMTGQLKEHVEDKLAFDAIELVTFNRRTRPFDPFLEDVIHPIE